MTDQDAPAKEHPQDLLTGARLRAAGSTELKRETARAVRTGQPMSVAFVDVDRLEHINDSRGHAAGDRMLVAVADLLRTSTRSGDLILRCGADEFLCVLVGMRQEEALERLGRVNRALAAAPEGGSVTIEVVELRPDEMVDLLGGRADVALHEQQSEVHVVRRPSRTQLPGTR